MEHLAKTLLAARTTKPQKAEEALMTKERPIIMSAESVRAILAGHKTQTRRVMNPQPVEHDGAFMWKGHRDYLWGAVNNSRKPIDLAPHGRIGDRLWVRETWGYPKNGLAQPVHHYRANVEAPNGPHLKHYSVENFRWKSPIYMPRWASHILLEITDVRVERLQEISEKDAIAEGCVGHETYTSQTSEGEPLETLTPRDEFSTRWNALNAKRGFPWESNPWVWVYDFKEVK